MVKYYIEQWVDHVFGVAQLGILATCVLLKGNLEKKQSKDFIVGNLCFVNAHSEKESIAMTKPFLYDLISIRSYMKELGQ